MDFAAEGQFAEQEFFGEGFLDLFLDDARHRAGAVQFVVALFGQPCAGIAVELDVDVLVGELEFELQDEFVDDAADDFGRQVGEGDDGVEAVAEFGVNIRWTASLPASSFDTSPKPMPCLAMSDAPALVVMIRTTLRKSTVLPW